MRYSSYRMRLWTSGIVTQVSCNKLSTVKHRHLTCGTSYSILSMVVVEQVWHEIVAWKRGIKVWHRCVAWNCCICNYCRQRFFDKMSANQFLGKYENVFLSGENVLFGKRKLEMCTKKGKNCLFHFLLSWLLFVRSSYLYFQVADRTGFFFVSVFLSG